MYHILTLTPAPAVPTRKYSTESRRYYFVYLAAFGSRGRSAHTLAPESHRVSGRYHAKRLRDAISPGRSSTRVYSLKGYVAVSSLQSARDFTPIAAIDRAFSVKRDREQILQVALEPNTPGVSKICVVGNFWAETVEQVIKETIAAFYDAVTSVANATKLATHVNDLEAFMSDIVTSVKRGNCSKYKLHPAESSSNLDMIARAVAINLVRRHAQSSYRFVHAIHSKDPDIMSTFIDWDRSAFDFMKDGVPGNGNVRAGMDDDVLRDITSQQRSSILSETRLLASWTKMHKALEDIKHRIDVAQLDDASFTADPYQLFKRLLERDDELKSVMTSQAGISIVSPEQSIEWIWYASTKPAISTIAPTRTATSERARPPLGVENIRLLLSRYHDMISKPLSTAR